MKQRISFTDFEEARITSGLFFGRMLSELDITERTYYRWKESGSVPHWAMRIVELLSGDLEPHGWKHWNIKNGVLTCAQLNARYYRWTPGEILSSRLMGVNPSRPVPVSGPSRNVQLARPLKALISVSVDRQQQEGAAR